MATGKAELLDVPRNLVEGWWLALRHAGFEVDLNAPLNADVPAEPDGISYRPGTVRQGTAHVTIRPCFGPLPPSTSALCGKYLILVESSNHESNVSLAKQVIGVFVGLGAHTVHRPP
jgi:hypothetical protein